MENVDGYVIDRSGNTVSLQFTDIFGEGEVYRFPLEDAENICAALATVLARNE